MTRPTLLHSRRRQVSGTRVTLQDRGIIRTSTTSQPTAFWSLVSTGIVQFSGLAGGTTTGETWLVSGLNSDYEVRFTDVASDLVPTGVTFGTWLACSTSRTVNYTAPTQDNTDYAATILVEIRDKVTLAVLATATISMSVKWT